MYRRAVAYALTAPVAIALDVSWAGFFMRSFYQSELKAFLAPTFAVPPLVCFYLLITSGIFYFAAYPGYRSGSIAKAAFSGAFLGLLSYGTYDLINMSTLPAWPPVMTAVDMSWGCFICGLTAILGFSFLKLLRA